MIAGVRREYVYLASIARTLWLLRLVQLHFRVTPLGLPKIIGGEETVAVTASFDDRTLARLYETRKASTPTGAIEN